MLVWGRKLVSKSGILSVRKFSMPLQAPIPQSAPPVMGFNIVANRIANMVLNITEKNPSNVLHVYPENHMLAYVGEVDYLAMSALRSDSAQSWMPQQFS